MVVAAGDHVFDRTAVVYGAHRDLMQRIDQVTQLDRQTRVDLDADILNTLLTIADAGIRVGYALARTWPDHADELESWPNKALAFLGADAFTACHSDRTDEYGGVA